MDRAEASPGDAGLARFARRAGEALQAPVDVLQRDLPMLQLHEERLARYLAAVHAQPVTLELQMLRESLRIDTLMAELSVLRQGLVEAAQRAADIAAGLQRAASPVGQARVPVPLHEALQDAVAWVRGAVVQAFDVRMEALEPCTVQADREGLQQVLVHLVQNACDAATAQDLSPQLTLSLRRQGAQAELRIADNGPGVAAADLPRLFEPFFTTRAAGQGVGLGLWSCRAIVQAHGGTLSGANGTGGGAVFTLRLPLAQP